MGFDGQKGTLPAPRGITVFFGDTARRIGPFRCLRPKYEVLAGHCTVDASRTKSVLQELIKIAINGGKISNADDVTISNSASVFDFAYAILMNELYPGKEDKRTGDVVITAVYERMQKVRKNRA